MNKNKENKKRSKTSIIIAWIILLLSVSFALILTYLKFFGPNPNIEEHSAEDVNQAAEQSQIKLLELIIDNFNNSAITKEYLNQNINMQAILEEKSIIIDYQSEKTFVFSYSQPYLEVSIDNTDKEIFTNVFRAMVYANQLRLKNETNIDNYITGFLNENTPVNGLTVKTSDNITTTYNIDISKVINDENNQPAQEPLDSNQTTPENNTTTNQPNTTIEDTTTTNTNNNEGSE